MDRKTEKKTVSELIEEAKRGSIYDDVISSVEKVLLKSSLNRSFGNQSLAARLLGINRNTMRLKMRKYSLDRSEYKFREKEI